MISCIIQILEIKPGVVTVNMVPDNSIGTELERGTASVLDVAIKTTAVYLMEKAGAGEMIEGQDVEHLVRASIQRALKT